MLLTVFIFGCFITIALEVEPWLARLKCRHYASLGLLNWRSSSGWDECGAENSSLKNTVKHVDWGWNLLDELDWLFKWQTEGLRWVWVGWVDNWIGYLNADDEISLKGSRNTLYSTSDSPKARHILISISVRHERGENISSLALLRAHHCHIRLFWWNIQWFHADLRVNDYLLAPSAETQRRSGSEGSWQEQFRSWMLDIVKKLWSHSGCLLIRN